MTAHRHSAYRETGQRGGRKTQEALARLHSARSLNRSQGFTAGCRGSSLAPLGRRSFFDLLQFGDCSTQSGNNRRRSIVASAEPGTYPAITNSIFSSLVIAASKPRTATCKGVSVGGATKNKQRLNERDGLNPSTAKAVLRDGVPTP